MLTDLNQMYLYGWASTGSSKKIVKECMNIVINTLYVFNFGNHFFYSENISFYRFLQLSPICGFVNITSARNKFWPTKPIPDMVFVQLTSARNRFYSVKASYET